MDQGLKHFLSLILLLSFLLTSILHVHEVAGWSGEVDKFVVCESIDASGEILKPTNVKDYFLNNASEIFAYLHMKNSGGPVTIKIEWIEPDGNIYTFSEFWPIIGGSLNITRFSCLGISDVSYKTGRWTVNAYANDELISSTDFDLLLPNPVLTVVGIAHKPVIWTERTSQFHIENHIGNTITITYTLKNAGGVAANQVKMAMEDLSPSNGLSIQRASETKDLGSRATDKWTLEILCEKPGSYLGTSAMYLENRRVSDWKWTITVTLPELDLVNIKSSPEEWERIHPGDIVAKTYIFRNFGKFDAKQVGISVELPEDLKLISVTPAKDIGRGQDAEYVIKLETKKVGSFEGNVTLDSFGYKIHEGKMTVNVLARASLFNMRILATFGIIVLIFTIVVIILVKRRYIEGYLKSVRPGFFIRAKRCQATFNIGIEIDLC